MSSSSTDTNLFFFNLIVSIFRRAVHQSIPVIKQLLVFCVFNKLRMCIKYTDHCRQHPLQNFKRSAFSSTSMFSYQVSGVSLPFSTTYWRVQPAGVHVLPVQYPFSTVRTSNQPHGLFNARGNESRLRHCFAREYSARVQCERERERGHS